MTEIEFTPVNSVVELATYYEALSQPGVASIQLTTQGSDDHPVILLEQEEEDYLLFDLTAVRDLAPPLRRGVTFLLKGYTPGGLVRSNPMKMRELTTVEGRLFAYADWPTEINVQQRRASFRATLRMGMDVGVILRSSDNEQGEEVELQGDLKDLSATGCLAEFFAQDGVSKVLPNLETAIELYFPNGTRFSVNSIVKHIRTDNDRQVLAVGFEFDNISKADERQLWDFVREIEREASRNAIEGDNNRQPSELFQVKEGDENKLGRRQGHAYATPMARRLARIAGYLDSQMVSLRQGQPMNSSQLSQHADRLLDMLDDSREEALFAVHCIHRESRWIRHGLAVAVRLVDLLSATKVPRDVRKAVAACAMIHDIGKGLLPAEIWRATTLSTEIYEQMQTHVMMLMDKMTSCKWLSPVIQFNVIEQINERLNGSGYPAESRSDKLGQLARAAAVVDVIDALQRGRPDRKGLSTVSAWKFVDARLDEFDANWIHKYQQHFGGVPIGTLVKFEHGQLAWVVGLDKQRRISHVRLTPHKGAPDDKLGDVVELASLQEVGRIVDVIAPDY